MASNGSRDDDSEDNFEDAQDKFYDADSDEEENFETVIKNFEKTLGISAEDGSEVSSTKTTIKDLDSIDSLNKKKSKNGELKDSENKGPNLEESLADMARAVDLYFNNEIDEAMSFVRQYQGVTIYHTSLTSLLQLNIALLTSERKEFIKARDDFTMTINICEKKRKHNSWSESFVNLFKSANYDQFTDEELHAELVYSEDIIMSGLCAFICDQSVVNLLKFAIKSNSAYNSLKFCLDVVNKRKDWESETIRDEFICGTYFGMGMTNLILSQFPSSIINLMKIMGYSGDKELGLDYLSKCIQLKGTLRKHVAAMQIILYNTYVHQIYGVGAPDLEYVRQIIDDYNQDHPKSAVWRLFRGKYYQMLGSPGKALKCFQETKALINPLTYYDNACNWDITWCYAIQCDWINAAKYAETLFSTCSWSPPTFVYQIASFKYMINCLSDPTSKLFQEDNNNDIKPKKIEEIDELMQNVPKCRVRYAGKTLPLEKFVISKSIHYLEGDHHLTVPAIELMYMWNVLGTSNGEPNLLRPLISMIEKEMKFILESPTNPIMNDSYSVDDLAVLVILKGACLRLLKEHTIAIECFEQIFDWEKRITRDTYLLPFATFELGLTYISAGQLIDAKLYLEKARGFKKGYLNYAYMQMKSHNALKHVQDLL